MKVRLDVNTGLVNSFAIAYKFTDNYDTRDQWTNRFKRFKQKEKSTLYGAANLMKTAAPLLVNYLGLDKSKTVFIPALSSRVYGVCLGKNESRIYQRDFK